MFRYNEKLKFLPILTHADVAATETPTPYVNLAEAHWATFVIDFGAITASTVAVTIECSTAASSNPTEVTKAFNYRKSGVIGSDDMGAITAATTTGAALTATDDNKTLLIEIDPQEVAALGDDYQYVRAVITPASDMSAFIVGASVILEPRYPGNDITSAT